MQMFILYGFQFFKMRFTLIAMQALCQGKLYITSTISNGLKKYLIGLVCLAWSYPRYNPTSADVISNLQSDIWTDMRSDIGLDHSQKVFSCLGLSQCSACTSWFSGLLFVNCYPYHINLMSRNHQSFRISIEAQAKDTVSCRYKRWDLELYDSQQIFYMTARKKAQWSFPWSVGIEIPDYVSGPSKGSLLKTISNRCRCLLFSFSKRQKAKKFCSRQKG